MYSFDLPLMKALDWAETFGNIVTINICPLISLASEVKFSIRNHTIDTVIHTIDIVIKV